MLRPLPRGAGLRHEGLKPANGKGHRGVDAIIDTSGKKAKVLLNDSKQYVDVDLGKMANKAEARLEGRTDVREDGRDEAHRQEDALTEARVRPLRLAYIMKSNRSVAVRPLAADALRSQPKIRIVGRTC